MTRRKIKERLGEAKDNVKNFRRTKNEMSICYYTGWLDALKWVLKKK